MGSRLKLHEMLVDILGSRNVYFQPPPTLEMKYPAIRYSLADIQNIFADDAVYKQSRVYEIIVIDKNPDSSIIDEISKLPTCRFNRQYKADNLNHTVFLLHF